MTRSETLEERVEKLERTLAYFMEQHPSRFMELPVADRVSRARMPLPEDIKPPDWRSRT